jgi:hypothetical protein
MVSSAVLDPAISDQIAVDHSIEPRILFAHVALLFIKQGGSLEILRNAEPWNETGTPSWAPNWALAIS